MEVPGIRGAPLTRTLFLRKRAPCRDGVPWWDPSVETKPGKERMTRSNPFTKALLRLGVLGLLLLLPATAMADDLRSRLEAANTRIVEHERSEFADEAASEFAAVRLEITDAQGLLAAGEVRQANSVILRIEARKRLIGSVIQRATFEALADQRESAAIEMLHEADNTQIEMESAIQRRQQLQDEVQSILETLQGELR